jgi:cytochrome c-type biogenesis protein CcmH/NrfG
MPTTRRRGPTPKPWKSDKRLAQTNPERYEPDVAMTQNNLGIMYRNLNAYDKAEGAYAEALEIR